MKKPIIFLLLVLLFLSSPMMAEDKNPIGATWVICIDYSKSGLQSDPKGLSLATASWLLDWLQFQNPNNRAAILFFSSKVHIYPQQAPNADFQGMQEFLHNYDKKRGYTNIEAALTVARQHLQKEDAGRKKFVVLISDGGISIDPRDHFSEEELQRIWGEEGEEGIAARMVEVNDRSWQTVENSLLPAFRDEKIRIIPLGFAQGDLKLLKKMAQDTGGGSEDEIQLLKSPEDLIPALLKLLPMPEGMLTLSNGDIYKVGEDFKVNFPSHIKKFQVAVEFLEPVDKDVDYSLQNSSGESISLLSNDQNILHISTNKFLRLARVRGVGKGVDETYALKCTHQQGGTVPKLRWFVHAYTDLEVSCHIKSKSGLFTTKDQFRVEVNLKHKQSIFSMQKIQANISREGERASNVFLQLARNRLRAEGPITFPNSGKYRLHLKVFLAPSGYITYDQGIDIQPPKRVSFLIYSKPGGATVGDDHNIVVFIPCKQFRANKNASEESAILAIPDLGGKRKNFRIEPVCISNQTPYPFTFSISRKNTLCHTSGTVTIGMEEVLENWDELTTETHVAPGQRVEISFAFKMPDKFYERHSPLVSGIYSGRLKIQSNVLRPVYIPVKISLIVPEFKVFYQGHRVDIQNPDTRDPVIVIYREELKKSTPTNPLIRGLTNFKVETTSWEAQKVTLALNSRFLKSDEYGSTQENSVTLGIGTAEKVQHTVQITGNKSDALPGEIPLWLHAKGPVKPGIYENTIILMWNGERIGKFRIRLEVRQFPIHDWVYVLLIIVTVLMILPWGWKFIRRYLVTFSGREQKLCLDDSEDTSATAHFPSLLKLIYEMGTLSLQVFRPAVIKDEDMNEYRLLPGESITLKKDHYHRIQMVPQWKFTISPAISGWRMTMNSWPYTWKQLIRRLLVVLGTAGIIEYMRLSPEVVIEIARFFNFL